MRKYALLPLALLLGACGVDWGAVIDEDAAVDQLQAQIETMTGLTDAQQCGIYLTAKMVAPQFVAAAEARMLETGLDPKLCVPPAEAPEEA
jgi:hypothetical protein